MKKFILSEILILSQAEKKAKKVAFDPRKTLIFGKNGTGKSCLIKSIYKAFGASPFKDHPTWKRLNPILFVRFKVNDVKYSILKDGKFYAVYDSDDKLINVFESVTNELGIFLADLFDFKIKLPNQNGELITPPPAFLFLPYYIDQDNSWQNNWASFSGLKQLKAYKEPIVSYHTGMKPNEYYTTKSEIGHYEVKIQELESERKILKSLITKVNEKMGPIEFNFDVEIFKSEIAELLAQCELLKNKQEALKAKLVDFYNIKISLDSQLILAKTALNETRKDYKYATDVLVEDNVDCPTCGAHYENTFLERFEIAKDEDRCKELVTELNREVAEIEDKIKKENDSYTKNSEEILRIEAILEVKKGEIKLKDVIENVGRNEIKTVFEENSNELMKSMTDNYIQKKFLDDKLKSLMDKEKRKEILKFYYSHMARFLSELDVQSMRDEKSYKSISGQIPETGSALPRALVAYYFSLFHVIKRYTSSVFCPIIIDSPNQQAQDLGHVDKILKFVNENQPDDSQMILGLEELYDVNFNCPIIELNEKGSLLQESDYDEVNAELDSFLVKMWNHGKEGRLFI